MTQALKARFKAPDASRRISPSACTAMIALSALGIEMHEFLGRCPRLE
jgi:hypothetical protein